MSLQELQQQVKTTLKLNTSLSQSLKTLQLSSEDLEEFIQQKVQENPFIEKKEKNFDELYQKYLSDRKIHSQNFENKNYDFTDNLSEQIDLKEYILQQINKIFVGRRDILIAYYLTDLLDYNGYLRENLDTICFNLKISKNYLLKILNKLKELEPVGVFSENIQECLSIQLKELNLFNNQYKILLENLELIAKGELNKLTKLIKTSKEHVIKMIHKIKSLEPKPGRNFNYEVAIPKKAEIAINLSNTGEVYATALTQNMTEIIVTKNLYKKSKISTNKTQEKNFLNDKITEALNINKSIEMRKKTVLEVAEYIAKYQEDFFKRGLLYLQPMTMSEVASALDYNESTISRAVNNKFVETPYGITEMKFFFSSKLKSQHSKINSSSHKVKEIIKNLIEEEDGSSPLADEEISEILKQFNVIAARRTVAKYRESMKIPSSSKRKRKHNMINSIT